MLAEGVDAPGAVLSANSTCMPRVSRALVRAKTFLTSSSTTSTFLPRSTELSSSASAGRAPSSTPASASWPGGPRSEGAGERDMAKGR